MIVFLCFSCQSCHGSSKISSHQSTRLLPSWSWSCGWIPASEGEVTFGPGCQLSSQPAKAPPNFLEPSKNRANQPGPVKALLGILPHQPFNPLKGLDKMNPHCRKERLIKRPPASSTWKNPWMSWILQGLEVHESNFKKKKTLLEICNYVGQRCFLLYAFYLKQILVWNSENCFFFDVFLRA